MLFRSPFPVPSHLYEEFRSHLDSLPDSDFKPKPGDDKPYRRQAKPIAESQPSDAGADRKRNEVIHQHKKVAHIRAARTNRRSATTAP